jgi:hypothetical protein
MAPSLRDLPPMEPGERLADYVYRVSQDIIEREIAAGRLARPAVQSERRQAWAEQLGYSRAGGGR